MHSALLCSLPPLFFLSPWQKNATIETAQSLIPAAQAAYDASLVPLQAALAAAQSNANVAYNNWQAAEADRAAYHDSLTNNFNDKLNM